VPRLIVNPGTTAQWEIPLRTGVTPIGRSSAGNPYPIDHPSVADQHAEIVVDDVGCLYRDLGSGQPSTVADFPVQEAYLQPGQSLRVGEVDLRFDLGVAAAANPAQPAIPSGKLFCRSHPGSPAMHYCGTCQKPFCSLCVSGRSGHHYCRVCGSACTAVDASAAFEPEVERSFYERIPGCFSYPFKGKGMWMMILGSIICAAVTFAAQFFCVAWGILVGYGVMYAQGIIQSSAQGEDEGPDWPNIDGGVFGALLPALLRYVVVMIAVFLPTMACEYMARDGSEIWEYAAIAFGVLGWCYLPMSLLAAGLLDSVGAISPTVVIPSILRIPGEYTVTVLLLGFLVALNAGIQLGFSHLTSVPFVPETLTGLFAFYLITVDVRILGVMYHSNRRQLGWL